MHNAGGPNQPAREPDTPSQDARVGDPRTQARAALTGLKGSPLDAPSVTPKHQLPADVASPGVAFANPQGASAGRWYATTLSNHGASSKDVILVYSDVRPTSKPIGDAHEGFKLTTRGDYLTQGRGRW